ncbi:hypothetical protein SAMN06265349_102890 [Flavobacterium resistens]|uniref:Uncharacterized protein n=1 Tax=Flavobacterium resistens TaxID=443612 RepID=A0A521CVA9_9FLAO|nr:hypothetical protein [Flavobacterium resistens]MRX66960.1 hypothetical protein [Flavobacterium resistens]SMO62661.1 hypothetical protein SAMN06265349_102890 [Flavobacterium resistens]
MKRIATLLLFMTSFVALAQQQFFVGKDSDLLTGKSVTIKEGKSSYSGFYKDSDLTKILFKKGIGSDPEKLKGLIFEVKGSMKHPKSYMDEIVLVLENKDQGTIYYSYMSKYESTFLLDVVGGLTPPEGFLCSRLSPMKDKFSSKVITDTPTNFEYSITKIEENGANRIYLRLQLYGTTLNIGKTGLKILFSDGTVLEKPDVKINSKVDTAGYVYSCFINLSKGDIEILSNKTITDYSLYIYERKIKDNNAYELKDYLKCLSK